MKCPKCHYLGLDTGPRCRHCGYEFSLSDLSAEPDRVAASELGSRPGTSGRRTTASPRFAHDRNTPTPGRALERPLARVPDSGPLDLPLFPEDASGVPVVPPPRPPLAVRRSTPTPARHRSRTPHRDDVGYDLGLDHLLATPPTEASESKPDQAPVREPQPDAPERPAVASPLRRIVAAATDFVLMAAIDATVLYFTLRVCELTVSQLAVLPPVPMAALFAILNGGYLVLFTGVFGQTLGKMLAGIEVVSHDLTPIDLGRALYRVIVSVLSILTAGLGFVPALFGEGRSLHDRIARTRVIPARPSHLHT